MEPFAELDPPLAQAVVAVLRDAHLRAWVEESGGDVDRVYVVREDHTAAEVTLTARMEDVQALARRIAEPPPPAGAARHDTGGEARRPLVLERFRRTAVVVVALLVPVLAVTLAQAALPRGAAAALVLLGVVAVAVLVRVAQRPP